MESKVVLIAAVDQNNVIGRAGALPWHYPEDLKYFKERTMGHGIVMGRKTWDSLPKKPLPHRANWVLSRNYARREQIRDAYPTVGALSAFKTVLSLLPPRGEWWVIGGADIYTEALLYANVIELTIVPERTEGDDLIYFPTIDKNVWHEVSTSPHPYHSELKCTRYERRSPE